jgi:hypothetical protein
VTLRTGEVVAPPRGFRRLSLTGWGLFFFAVSASAPLTVLARPSWRATETGTRAEPDTGWYPSARPVKARSMNVSVGHGA